MCVCVCVCMCVIIHFYLFSEEINFFEDVELKEQLLDFALPESVLILMKSKLPLHILAFRVITNNNDIMSDFIILHCVKITWRPILSVLSYCWLGSREGQREAPRSGNISLRVPPNQ